MPLWARPSACRRSCGAPGCRRRPPRKVKAHFERLFSSEALGTKRVYVNGQEVVAKAYFKRHRPAVDAGLEELHGERGPRGGAERHGHVPDAVDGRASSAAAGIRLLDHFFGAASSPAER